MLKIMLKDASLQSQLIAPSATLMRRPAQHNKAFIKAFSCSNQHWVEPLTLGFMLASNEAGADAVELLQIFSRQTMS